VIRNFRSVVAKKLNQQCHLDGIDPSEPSITLLATLLDPRFKDIKFLNHSQKLLLESSLTYLVNCNTSDTTTSTTGSTSCHATALDILLREDNSFESSSGDCVTETVRAYLSDSIPSHESSPLQWWKTIVQDTIYFYL